MGKIVAIGGGELATGQTFAIDGFVVKLAGQTVPKALFVGTASHDNDGYYQAFKSEYEKLGCAVDSLMLTKGPVNVNLVRSKIFSSDIIYVGGGDTEFMLTVWKRYGIDQMLKTAHGRGCVLAGLSAGANCWFTYAVSDSGGNLHLTRGIGLIHGCVCPHYDNAEWREFALKTGKDMVALESLTAFASIDGTEGFVRCESVNKAFYISENREKEVTEWICI